MCACSMHVPQGDITAQHAVLHTFQAITTYYKSQPVHAHSRGRLITGFQGWVFAQTALPITMELNPAV